MTDPNRPPELQAPSGPLSRSSFTVFKPVAIADIAKCLGAVDPYKATGCDGVPGVVLRNCADIIAPHLAMVINSSFSMATVPKIFKCSHVCPLFKSGDKSSPRNYRPVSLLPIASRILEYFLKEQLTDFLSTNGLYPTSQFAYRKQDSTEDALILATNCWQLAKSERKYTVVAMLDMSKAFDRAQHEKLISELFSLGIGGAALTWFISYLSERRQRVKVDDRLSSTVCYTRGVPQGSVPGPILFVLYTRQLRSVVHPDVFSQEFVDDIILDYSHHDPRQLNLVLGSALNAVSDWLSDIGLLLNTQKTQVMFLRPRGVAQETPAFFCGTDQLQVTPTAKYLGVIIDENLWWRPHVNYLAGKVTKKIGPLWRHGRSLSLRSQRMWYISMVQSQLAYGWNAFLPGSSAQLLVRLDRMRKAGIRAVFRQPQRTPTAPLLSRLNLLALPVYFNNKILIFVHRVVNNSASSLFNEYFKLIDTAIADGPGTNRITRGQASKLLQIPFFRGPASRLSMQSVGSRLWNALPHTTRLINNSKEFKSIIFSSSAPALVT